MKMILDRYPRSGLQKGEPLLHANRWAPLKRSILLAQAQSKKCEPGPVKGVATNSPINVFLNRPEVRAWAVKRFRPGVDFITLLEEAVEDGILPPSYPHRVGRSRLCQTTRSSSAKHFLINLAQEEGWVVARTPGVNRWFIRRGDN